MASKKGRCPYCSVRCDTNEEIYNHMNAHHKLLMGDRTPKHVHYVYRNGNPTCHLTGCSNDCGWDTKNDKAYFYCSEACRVKHGRIAKANHAAVYDGREHNLNIPGEQIRRQDAREISGVIKCDDDTEIPYMGKSEMGCVELLIERFDVTGVDITRPSIFFEYIGADKKKHTYITDYENHQMMAIIECKERLDNINNHPAMIKKRRMDFRKETAAIESNSRHFLRYHPDDIKGFCEAYAEMEKRNGKIKGHPFVYTPRGYYVFLEKRKKSKHVESFAVKDTGIHVGDVYIDKGTDSDNMFLSLFISKAHQRRGLGRRALKMACNELSYDTLYIETRKGNKEMIGAAINVGFVDVDYDSPQRVMVWHRPVKN